ncbi:MAG: hypothetical protein WDA06_08895 [Phenylobacterium sp.]
MAEFDIDELKTIPVGKKKKNWESIECPHCKKDNWMQFIDNVVDIINCHNCFRFFYGRDVSKEFILETGLIEQANIAYGKEKPTF